MLQGEVSLEIIQPFAALICIQTLPIKAMLSKHMVAQYIVSHSVFLLTIFLALAFCFTFSSRNKRSSTDVANSLHIAPEITILCKVQKHTVPFHMFLPVRLGLYPLLYLQRPQGGFVFWQLMNHCDSGLLEANLYYTYRFPLPN